MFVVFDVETFFKPCYQESLSIIIRQLRIVMRAACCKIFKLINSLHENPNPEGE